MSSTAAVVQQYWDEQHELMVQLPVKVRAREPESIHDLRAAGRRLKATVRIFNPLIRRRLAAELLAGLDWYNTELGRARDAEVIRDEVGEVITDIAGGAELMTTLRQRAERAAQFTDLVLASERTADIVAAVGELVRRPWRRFGPSRDEITARVAWAEYRVASQWRHGPVDYEPVHEWQHRLRRSAKAARYANEAVAGAELAATDRAERYASIAKVLGQAQDAVVIRQALASWPAELVTQIVAIFDQRCDEALQQIPSKMQAVLVSCA